MSTNRRPQRRSQSTRSRRDSFLKRKPHRVLHTERLESRAMLAGDLSSLTLSDYLSYQLPTEMHSAGAVAALDHNEPDAEGEDPQLVKFSFVPVAHGTNIPITSIPEGGHYELRVLMQDLGVTEFNNDTRDPTQSNGLSALGGFTAFVDMFWDRAQTDVQVNETQTIVINGSPTTNTRFTLRFTDIDGTTQTTAPIAFAGANREQTAANIRNALVALTKISTSRVGALPNIEVDIGANSRTFHVRFINDEANKDFLNLSGLITVPGGSPGASGITVTESVKGNPALLVSFQEMFRPRAVRNAAFDVINDDQHDLLYFTSYLGIVGDRPAAAPIAGGVRNAGGTNGPLLADLTGPRPGTQIVEVFRLRMTAKDKIGSAPITFSGAYPQPSSNLSVILLGDASPNEGAFSAPIPATSVTFQSANLNITEPVSAVNDVATVNEGTTPTNLNRVAIDVLGPAGVAGSDQDNTGPYNLQLVQTPILPPGFQGTVTFRAANLDGIPRPHFLYTVPNADFNGVVTFQYTIRDGAATPTPVPTDIGTVTITVNPTNDAPVNSGPGAQTVAEDAPAGLVFGAGNAISVSDVDAAAGNVSVNLIATNGVLSVPSAPATPGNGTANVTITGTIAQINAALSGLTYTPNGNFVGSATITIVTNDNGNTGAGGALSDTDIIAINVTASNDAPVNSAPASVQVDENATIQFTNGNTISVADVDVAGGNLSVNLTTNSANGGQLSVTAAGGAGVSGNNSQNLTVTGTLAAVNSTLSSLRFAAGLPETVTLTITTSDQGNTGAGGAKTDVDTVTIDVLATVRPRATPDILNRSEGPATFDLNVLANDFANTGAQVTLVSLGSVSVGSITRNENGTPGVLTDDTITYTPPSADFFGQVTFTYTIGETPVTGATVIGPNATAQVTLNIANTDDAPVSANDGPYAATEDLALTVNAAIGVLANDSDADNLAPTAANAGLTAVLVPVSAVGGSVNLASNGSFVFTPTVNFSGDASFRYRARDPQGNLSDEATVTINFAADNDAPVAVNDVPGVVLVTNEEAPLTVAVANGVLGNDTDVDSPQGNLTAVLVPGSEVGGSVSLAADGSFVFTPALNFNGTASFRYRANDNDSTNPLLSNEATVSIAVLPVNDVPVAGNAMFTIDETQTLNRTAANGLRTLVTDPDQPSGFTGSIALVSPPSQGTLNLNSDGSFSYIPPTTVGDTDIFVTFTFTASDGLSTSNEGTVTIRVTPFNDPPVANFDNVVDGPFQATEGEALTIPRASILGNDTDEETANADLIAHIVTNVPANAGSVVVNGDGSFTYTPAADFFTLPGSPISFTYQVEDDGAKLSNTVSVAINVQEVNDDPIANDNFFSPVIKGLSNQLLADPKLNDSVGVDAGANPGDVLVVTHVNGDTSSATTAQGNTVRLVNGQLFYDETVGITGNDSFEYTISDGRGGTATATYTIEVVDFIPKSISGTVFIDKDNDGRVDGGEKRIAGVQIRLNGTNVLGTPNFAPLVVFTDARGNYSFSGLKPGNYTVTEIQPKYLTDGMDKLAAPNSLVKGVTNNRFVMTWNVPQSISTGGITGVNFGERGINARALVNSAGLKGEMLASSGANGMVLAINNRTGQTLWSYNHLGWNTTATLRLQFASNGAPPSALLTVNGVTKRIFQSPSRNTGTGTPPSPPRGSQARFRIIGHNGQGEYIIRLDGSMSAFGFVAAAAAPQLGEGESAPAMSDGQYRQAADQLFAEKGWA